ncbi:aminoglycoside phosphotransferase family protein [Streptomyces calidiresistens]|uniref:Phosphotransferase n=1 Tax=Streptomyces calidiresistens TaxID=1485586 RepID=A0A7W3T5X0_9ACTN|nr:aminoglycoside phosphotransferase family protein [Streptomyces calidiresistens]MBB0231525.1 phosphotransferase [Streptomyces calidiresistens]
MSTQPSPPGAGTVRAADEALVRRLVADRFPRWAGLPVTRLPSGGTVNAVYRLGGDMLVRLPLGEAGARDVEREGTWLPRLAPLLPVAVPEVLGVGEPTEEFPRPWSVYRWLEGEHPEPGALEDPVGLAGDLAAFVAAMGAIGLPGGPAAHRGGPVTSLDAATRAAIEELRGLPEEGIDCDAALAVWEETPHASPGGEPPVWLHADLMPGNLLVRGGRLVAVIDFGCAGTGDPACDLFPAWNLLPAGAREVFLDGLGVDEPTRLRGRGRTLSQALISLPYHRTRNPAMAANARHVLRTVLEAPASRP